MAVTVGGAAVVMVVAGFIYYRSSNESTPEKVNGLRFVAAARGYTRMLVASKQPIPATVSLNELLARGFLKPADVAPFQGLQTEIILTSDASNPRAALMRVHLSDGTDLVLFNDGSTQQVRR